MGWIQSKISDRNLRALESNPEVRGSSQCLLTCKAQPEGCSLPHYAHNPRATPSRISAAFLGEDQ